MGVIAINIARPLNGFDYGQGFCGYESIVIEKSRDNVEEDDSTLIAALKGLEWELGLQLIFTKLYII